MNPLANQTYRRLLTAQVIALAGTGLSTIALALLAYELTGGDAGTILGIALTLKMVAYVAFWSTALVAWAIPRLTFNCALGLAMILWVVALVVFFPSNGWGFLGLGVGPKLIAASLIPHVLFAVFLWDLDRVMFTASPAGETSDS